MLTDRKIKQAPPPDDGRKLYKLYDSKGLYLGPPGSHCPTRSPKLPHHHRPRTDRQAPSGH